MRLVVDTGVFSAALSRRRRDPLHQFVSLLSGNQVMLAAQTVAELRFGALAAGWGQARRGQLEDAIAATTVIPVTDALISQVADLRLACHLAGHPLAARVHSSDLWIAANAIHVQARLGHGRQGVRRSAWPRSGHLTPKPPGRANLVSDDRPSSSGTKHWRMAG